MLKLMRPSRRKPEEKALSLGVVKNYQKYNVGIIHSEYEKWQ